MCPRDQVLDPAALANLIRWQQIECVESSALAEALATYVERQGEDLSGVRILTVGRTRCNSVFSLGFIVLSAPAVA